MNKIKVFRKKCNMNQSDLAKKLNLSRTTITKWETGKTYPRIQMLLKIAKILKYTVQDLLCEK